MPRHTALLPLALSSLLAASACNSAPPVVVAEPPPAHAAPPLSAAPEAPAKAGGARPAKSPADADALLAQAEKCLADVACNDATADALYRDADDAGAKVDCFRFYYGIGVAKDAARARACFERQVEPGGCEGSSPMLDRAYLATMLLDGQGGPAAPERVKEVFAGCVADVTVGALEGQVQGRTLRSPLDFCDRIGGTTITIGQCAGIETLRIEDRKHKVDRDVLGKLDATGKEAARRARELHLAFAEKEAEAASDKYRGGSLQSNAWRYVRNQLENQRVARLAEGWGRALAPGAGEAAAGGEFETAFKAARDGDAQHKRLFDEAARAWVTYRDAEVALYVHALGKREAVAAASGVRAMLTEAYAKELEDAVRP